MKRIHLFEFEDFTWFPSFLRICLTNYILTLHKLMDSSSNISDLLRRLIKKTHQQKIVDLCSGAGGPMPMVYEKLKKDFENLELTLTDLYPNSQAVKRIGQDKPVKYEPESINAADIPIKLSGIRCMICSMHHMKPLALKSILKDAMDKRQPFLGYEISDNSFPKALWWIAFPINIITTLLLTLIVRPVTWQQVIFTYLIPVLPIIIAWDGAVSNARTYTLQDMDLILQDLQSESYQWEKGAIPGKGGNKLYLMGIPK